MSINPTEEQSRQISDLRNYVEEYCQANGIDPGIYTNALENSAGIDPALLNDPIFQAYWQLAYLQLMEIVNPAHVQSLYSEVGEVSFEELYKRTDEETNEFIRSLVVQTPELMAFAAAADNNALSDPQKILRALSEGIPPPPLEELEGEPLPEYRDEEARRLKEEFGLSDTWDWLIGTEEGVRSTENFLMGELAQLDEQLAVLKQDLKGEKISAEEFSADVSQISGQREFIMASIQNLENNLSQILEVMSRVIKQRSDMMQSLAQNMRA